MWRMALGCHQTHFGSLLSVLVQPKNLHNSFLLVKTDQRGTPLIYYMQSFTLTLASNKDTHRNTFAPPFWSHGYSPPPPSNYVRNRLLPLVLFSGKDVDVVARLHTFSSTGFGCKLFICIGSASWVYFTILGSELELGS